MTEEIWRGLPKNCRFFEELNIGDKFTTTSRTVSRGDLSILCGVAGMDRHAHENIHISEEYAKKMGFKGRVAPGILTISITYGLFSQSNLGGFLFLGMDKVRLTAPIYPGDTLRVESEVVGKRETTMMRKKVGIIRFKNLCKNQEGKTVCEAEILSMYPRRK